MDEMAARRKLPRLVDHQEGVSDTFFGKCLRHVVPILILVLLSPTDTARAHQVLLEFHRKRAGVGVRWGCPTVDIQVRQNILARLRGVQRCGLEGAPGVEDACVGEWISDVLLEHFDARNGVCVEAFEEVLLESRRWKGYRIGQAAEKPQRHKEGGVEEHFGKHLQTG